MRTNSKDDQLWAYDEPVAGCDERGQPVTCNRQVVMTRRAILCLMRAVVMHKRPTLHISDDDLVEDWISVHWAYRVKSKK